MNNLPQISGTLADTVDAADSISQPVRISAQELHKYVVGLISVFALIVSTYPISMSRVTEKEKFAPYKFHLKSLTPEYKQVEPQSETAP